LADTQKNWFRIQQILLIIHETLMNRTSALLPLASSISISGEWVSLLFELAAEVEEGEREREIVRERERER
jgi:hypothetical protein